MQAEHRADRIQQAEVRREISRRNPVVEQGHVEGRAALAGGEVQRPGRADRLVVHARHRRPAHHILILHGGRPVQPVAPQHGDLRRHAAFDPREARGFKLERTGAGIIPAVQPHEPVGQHPVEAHERPTGDDPPVVELHQHRRHAAVRAQTKVDRGINRAVGVEPRNPAASEAAHAGEIATRHDPSVRLHREGLDRVIEAGPEVEGAVARTIGIQPHHPQRGRSVERSERTTHENFSGRIQHHRAHRSIEAAARVEAEIKRPSRREPREPSARLPGKLREVARDQHPPVRLHRHRADLIIRADPGIERRIHRPVRIQPRDQIAHGGVEDRERAADHGLAVRLERHGEDRVVRADAGIVRQVERAIRAKPRDAIPGDTANRLEITHGDDPAIGLHRHAADRGIGTAAGVEREIDRAIHIDPREILRRHAVEEIIRAAHDHLAEQTGQRGVGDDRQGLHLRPAAPEAEARQTGPGVGQFREAALEFAVVVREHAPDESAINDQSRGRRLDGTVVPPATAARSLVDQDRHHRRGARTVGDDERRLANEVGVDQPDAFVIHPQIVRSGDKIDVQREHPRRGTGIDGIGVGTPAGIRSRDRNRRRRDLAVGRHGPHLRLRAQSRVERRVQ